MKNFLKQLMAFALGICSAGIAVAIPITFNPVALSPTIYFPGTQQQTSGTIVPRAGVFTLDLIPGVALTEIPLGVAWRTGQNDGTPFPNGPDETRELQFAFTFGTANISLSQTARVFQVNNNQFQFEITAGPTRTLDLGALGVLDLTPSTSLVFQLPSNSGDGQISNFLATTFLLRAPSPVAEPGVLSLLALGLLVLGLTTRGYSILKI